MADLFNVSTRQKEKLDPSQLNQAVLAGTHSYKAGERINVFDPKKPDDVFSVPSENVQKALSEGYEIESPEKGAVREYVNENKGIGGKLKTAALQFADEAGMGIPEIIFNKTGDPLEVTKFEALKKEHDIANALGGIAGFGASFLYGGPLFRGAAKTGQAAERALAQRLLAESGEQVAKKGIKSAAKNIAGKTTSKAAGVGVEGAIGTAPIAITEAMLGDYDQAAETLLFGAGIGGLFGGSAAATAPLGGQLKRLGKYTAEKTGIKDNIYKNFARKAAKTFTGVDEADIAEYIKNPTRINNAPDIETIKFDIDDDVADYRIAFEDATDELKRAKQALDDAAKEKQRELLQDQVPENIYATIETQLEDAKAGLGALSEQVEDLLGQSDVVLSKRELLKSFDSSINALKVTPGKTTISDEATTAVKKLEAQKLRIDQGYGDYLNGSMLRTVMQEVREDINWFRLAGDFNSKLNRARQRFTERISDGLKDSIPGYSDLMNEMSARSRSLEKMSKYFGKKERGLSSINALAPNKSATPRSASILEAVSEFAQTNNFDARDLAGEFFENKKLYRDFKNKKIGLEQFVPEHYQKFVEAEKAKRQAEDIFKPIKKLTPQRTQSIIRNQGFKNANIENRVALEELNKLTGKDYMQLIKDRNILNAFNKESTQGSRKTLLGTVLGGMSLGGIAGATVGGPVGAMAGAAAGAAADVYGARALKSFIDNQTDVAGILFAEQSMKSAAKKADRIPKVIKSLDKTVKKKMPKPVMTATIRFFGKDYEKADKDTKTRKLAKLREDLGRFRADPGLFESRIIEVTSPISENGANETASRLNMKLQQTVDFLFNEIPKPLKPANPFEKPRPFKPTDTELANFEQILETVLDPFAAIDALEAGSLSKNHVKVLKNIYPRMYNTIRERVYNSVMEGSIDLEYSDRLKLGMLLDTPLDVSLRPERILSIQSAFQFKDSELEEMGVSGSPDFTQGVATRSQELAAKKQG